MGPFGTEREARMAALAAIGPEAVEIIASQPQNLRMLTEACEAAGAGLGSFDARILDWLSGWESSTCAVVAGLISRAHATPPEAAAGAETRILSEVRAVLAAFDWEHGDRQLALEAIERIVLAGSAPAQEPAALASAGPVPAVTLTAGQLATVLDALADAGEYRRKEAAQWCADCESSPAEACGQHLDDLDAAQAYEALGAGLGGAQ